MLQLVNRRNQQTAIDKQLEKMGDDYSPGGHVVVRTEIDVRRPHNYQSDKFPVSQRAHVLLSLAKQKERDVCNCNVQR